MVNLRNLRKRNDVRFNKSYQISAPSNRQILDLLNEQVTDVRARREFLGRQVTKQTYLNCIIVGLERLGADAISHVFDLGAEILGPAITANEPNTPICATRPLWLAIAEKAESDRRDAIAPSVAVRPLTASRLPDRSTGDSRWLNRDETPVADGSYSPNRK